MSRMLVIIAALLLAGCATSRQINPADSAIPIYRTDHDALQRMANSPGVGQNYGTAWGLCIYGDIPGSADYGHPAIHYSAELTQTGSIAVLLYEGLGRMYVRRTGDTRIWDLLDDLGSPYAIAGFPVQSPSFPGRQVLAWDQSEKALRLRAEHAAIKAARTLEAKP